jgi:hypothetical protein
MDDKADEPMSGRCPLHDQDSQALGNSQNDVTQCGLCVPPRLPDSDGGLERRGGVGSFSELGCSSRALVGSSLRRGPFVMVVHLCLPMRFMAGYSRMGNQIEKEAAYVLHVKALRDSGAQCVHIGH